MDHLPQKIKLFWIQFRFNGGHFVIFAYIKNRMKCAIAINILNLKPFLRSWPLSERFNVREIEMTGFSIDCVVSHALNAKRLCTQV